MCVRAVVAVLLLLQTVGLCAFDLQYADWFTVSGLAHTQGRAVMPVSRGKYVNARVLDKTTFEFLKTCPAVCRQDGKGKVNIVSLRAAKTRPGMWIADVAVDDAWLLTFLIFAQGTDFSVLVPEPIRVVNQPWLATLKVQLVQRIKSAEITK